MVSSSLANWDGSQSGQNQKPDQSMSRTIQAIPVAAHSAKARLEELSGEVFNASFKKTEVDGRAGRDKNVPEKKSQVSYTSKTKDHVSRMFNEIEPDIPNGHAREDDAYSLTDKDAEGETVDGDDAMAVDDVLGAPSSSPSKTSRETKTHMDSYGSPLSSSLRSGDDAGGIFTPPPGQTYDSVLTPSSSQTRASPPRKRVVISHVDVPPLPRDSDPTTYRPIAPKGKPRPLPLPLVKRKRVQSQPGIKSHQDLGTALQAAMNNNGALQTVSRQRLQATNNPGVGSSSSSSISSPYISASETVRQKTRRQEQKREPERVDEGVHRQNKAKSVSNPVTRYASGSRGTSVSVMVFRSELEVAPTSVPVSPPVRAPAPRPNVASAEYDSMKDMVELVMTSIPEPSWPVLELNTRFLEHRTRYPLGKDDWNAVAMPLSAPRVPPAGKAPEGESGKEGESGQQGMESSIAGVPDDDMTTGGYFEVWKEGEASENEESDEDEGVESGDEEEDIVFLGMSNAEREPKWQVNVPRPRENVSASKSVEIPPRQIRVVDPIGTSEGWSSSQELPRPHRKLHSRPSIQYSASAQREKQKQSSKQHEKQKELAEKGSTRRVSEKALGKRRATSPELREDPRPSPSVSSAPRGLPAKHAASVNSLPHPTARASQFFHTPGVSARLAANPNPASAIPNTVLAAAPSSPPNAPPPPYPLLPPTSPTVALRQTGTVAGSISPSHKRPVANMRPTPRAPPAVSPSRAPAAHSPSARTPSIQSPSHRRPPANTAIRRLSGPNPSHPHTSLTHSISASPRLPAAPIQPIVHGHPRHRPSAPGTAPATQSHSTRLPPWAIQWSVPVPRILPTHSSSHGQPATGAHSNIHELPEHDPPSASRTHALHGHPVVNPSLAVHSPPSHNTIPTSPSTSIAMPSPHHPHAPSFAHTHHRVPTLSNAHAPSASHLLEPSPFFAHTNARGSDSPFLADYDTEPESSNKLYNYSSIGPDHGTRNYHTHSSTAGVNDLLLEDGRHDLEGPSPWIGDGLSAMELVPGFVNGTIDPSLLGGGQPVDEDASVLPLVQYASDSPSPPPFPSSPPAASSSVDPLVMYESRSPSPALGPSHHQSPASHCSRSSSRSLSPTRSVRDSQGLLRSAQSNYTSSDAASSSSSTEPLIHRLRRPRRAPNGMVATGDLILSSSDESWSPSDREKLHTKKFAKRSVTRKPNQSSDTDEEELPLAKMVSKLSHEKPAAPLAGGWLRQEELDYCHQCRRKTAILKLVCPCEKKYCVRCLTLRYTGELAYDLTRANFTCPLCKNSCNCDVCCRKRGEAYVSSRSHSQPSAKLPAGKKPKTSREFSNPLQGTRPRLGGKTNLPAPTVSGPVSYWATMYGLNGKIIGNAFVGDDGNEEVVVVRPLGEAASERKRERIFVGEVQEAWGLGDQYLLKDVDPISWRDRNHRPNERVYIGKKAPLYEPTAPMPQPPPVHINTAVHNQFVYDGDGFSSPLSSIEGDSDGEGAGEGESRLGLEPSVTEADFEAIAQEGLDSFLAKGPGKAFSVDSLLDTDVARAISLGLLACGVAVHLSAC